MQRRGKSIGGRKKKTVDDAVRGDIFRDETEAKSLVSFCARKISNEILIFGD